MAKYSFVHAGTEGIHEQQHNSATISKPCHALLLLLLSHVGCPSGHHECN